MAVAWRITKEDVAKAKLVDVGWHPSEIVKFEFKKSKDGDSNNAVFTFRVIGTGKFVGAEKTVFFSEKAPGMMTGLLTALGFTELPDGGYDAELDESLIGRKLLAHWIRGEYQGRPQNEINEYQALG